MKGSKRWFVIINPTSGNGSCKRKWPKIKAILKAEGFDFDFSFTKRSNHGSELTQNAINQGFKDVICIGGDGTLHNIINGLLQQRLTDSSAINIGVIPIGTGNDWVKTYNIPLDIEKSISIIKNGKLNQQDLGKIEFVGDDRKPVYFNNLAGIGFDGFVVSRVGKIKRLGSLAYLIGAISGLFAFKNFHAKVILNNKEIVTKSLMILVGLCRYSGGGMQLTQNPNPKDGLFDVAVAKDLSKFEIIKNLVNLFNGKIVNHSKVVNIKVNDLIIKTALTKRPFIQADGELIGTGNIRLSIIEKAFTFYSN